MTKIESQVLENSVSYQRYIEIVSKLWENGQTSASPLADNSPDMLHYSALNLSRMRRLEKTVRLTDETSAFLASISKPLIWLSISEGWCGDAAQILPVIEKMAATNPTFIQHRIVFRDENTELIDAFLTNGGRAIPKILILDDQNTVRAVWGPRPKAADVFVQEQRAIMLKLPENERAAFFNDLKTKLQQWYNNDKTKSIQTEFLEALRF
jgi:hypothetical protein